ncbi:hypothetical protein SAMN05421505_110101 [Sinosporangium album]|uniref:WXG100 family type VII secretion target n=1 Tax=Sinosporangium album TaxID=504805 RepID=A0A1G7YZ07_9ACTN|nr:hypothetical protein [Sinosporangium album]SDH01100.1 hypothetical protein SAMN05421505_110101 [Sinosporangium album]
MAEKKTLPIRDNSICPTTGAVTASPEQIKQWIMGTTPFTIEKAGAAHTSAAGLVKEQTEQLRGIATRLAEHWRSESSAKTQDALRMLAETGTELAAKLEMMGEALTDYGSRHLPDAQKKILALPDAGSSPRTIDEGAGGGTIGVPNTGNVIGGDASDDRTSQAQAIMRELNEAVVKVYYQVPTEVTYVLPIVDLPNDTGGAQPYVLPSVSNGSDPLYGTANGDYTGGGSSAGSSGGGSSGSVGGPSGDSSPGSIAGSASDSEGSENGADGRADSGQGSGQSGGQDGGSADGGGSAPAGSDSGQGDGAQGHAGDSSASPGAGGDSGDGTAPQVIGGDDGTGDTSNADMTNIADPRGTEVASVPPTITGVPTPGTWAPTAAVAPVGVVAPVGAVGAAPLGVPPVLGAPTGFPGTPSGMAPAAASAGAMGTAGTGMYPFMPMGTGAGAGTEGGYEHTTSLHEDPDSWAVSPDVTNPLIG